MMICPDCDSVDYFSIPSVGNGKCATCHGRSCKCVACNGTELCQLCGGQGQIAEPSRDTEKALSKMKLPFKSSE